MCVCRTTGKLHLNSMYLYKNELLKAFAEQQFVTLLAEIASRSLTYLITTFFLF